MIKPETNPNPRARILLVDDYEMIRVFLRSGLAELGFRRIEEAKNGFEAIVKLKQAYLNKDPYEVIFCDWNMPEKSGMDVLVECRRDKHLQTLPFIMVTAESEQDKVVEALKAGATDYIVKPIAPGILHKKMLKVMFKMAAAV